MNVGELKGYDCISQYEAAALLSGTSDTKSTEFYSALAQIERAIDAGLLPSKQAIDIAKNRKNGDKALLLQIRKGLLPVQTGENEKQTILRKVDLDLWLSQRDSSSKQNRPKPFSLETTGFDPSVAERLNILLQAYEKFWTDILVDSKAAPANKRVAAWIEDNSSVSRTVATHMASLIRPNWAKDRTWRDNQVSE